MEIDTGTHCYIMIMSFTRVKLGLNTVCIIPCVDEQGFDFM
jgi:hypothetical protein